MKNWSEYMPEHHAMKGKWIYNWFSNMAPSEILVDGKTYGSVENYYQAMKTTDESIHLQIRTTTPSNAKWLGRKIEIRKDWEQIKEDVMRKALEAKFTQHMFYRDMLLATDNDIIVEWNNWGDREWGADWQTGLGNNKLGILLMDTRKKLKEGKLQS